MSEHHSSIDRETFLKMTSMLIFQFSFWKYHAWLTCDAPPLVANQSFRENFAAWYLVKPGSLLYFDTCWRSRLGRCILSSKQRRGHCVGKLSHYQPKLSKFESQCFSQARWDCRHNVILTSWSCFGQHQLSFGSQSIGKNLCPQQRKHYDCFACESLVACLPLF